jgi:hypothetical protein
MSHTRLEPSVQPAKPRRVLACVQCQSRKVKCDRAFPCAKCIKTQVQCIPASLVSARPRRQRFPERELLKRIRHYESLLQENDISFDSLHPMDSVQSSYPGRKQSSTIDYTESVQIAITSSSWSRTGLPVCFSCHSDVFMLRSKQEKMPENSTCSVTSSSRSELDLDVEEVQATWRKVRLSNDQFLFGGSAMPAAKMSTLHPPQVQIFRLWQIYVERVDPLLKITHTASLQPRIVLAAADLTSTAPPLTALIFGIYCISIMSLSEEECRSIYGSIKQDLLSSYQFCCQQALIHCELLRTQDCEVLAAFLLYLVRASHAICRHRLTDLDINKIQYRSCIA